jgi:hypothetical protein
MAISTKKEIIILLRLRQIESYLETKIAYFGKNTQDMKMLVILKNTIDLLKRLDLNASGIKIDPDEFSDLKDEDLAGSGITDQLMEKLRNKDDNNKRKHK